MLFAIRLLKLHLLLPLSLIDVPSCLSSWSVRACQWVPCFAVFCFDTFLGCLCSSRQGICPRRDRCEFCRRLLILYYTLLPFFHQGNRQFLSLCWMYGGYLLIFWDLIPGFRTAGVYPKAFWFSREWPARTSTRTHGLSCSRILW